jgi:hypothetical protein
MVFKSGRKASRLPRLSSATERSPRVFIFEEIDMCNLSAYEKKIRALCGEVIRLKDSDELEQAVRELKVAIHDHLDGANRTHSSAVD